MEFGAEWQAANASLRPIAYKQFQNCWNEPDASHPKGTRRLIRLAAALAPGFETARNQYVPIVPPLLAWKRWAVTTGRWGWQARPVGRPTVATRLQCVATHCA